MPSSTQLGWRFLTPVFPMPLMTRSMNWNVIIRHVLLGMALVPSCVLRSWALAFPSSAFQTHGVPLHDSHVTSVVATSATATAANFLLFLLLSSLWTAPANAGYKKKLLTPEGKSQTTIKCETLRLCNLMLCALLT